MANLTTYRPQRGTTLSRLGGDFMTPFDTPLGTFQRLQEEVSRLANGFWPEGDFPPVWQPAVDIYEEGNQWVVKADIPGVEPNDINLQVTDDGLKISAETITEQQNQDKGYYRSERRYGSFRRFIPLPAEVDPNQVKAKFRNGVLEVRLPKSETSNRRIPVEAEGGSGASIRAGR